MPFMLSAAIMAGVATALIVQASYRHNFYTANLLLFHRWMAILPVLIVGFYLLYLLKSKALGDWSFSAVDRGMPRASACSTFTGWSWTKPSAQSAKPGVLVTSLHFGRRCTRAAKSCRGWCVALRSFPTLAVLVGWQLWWTQPGGCGIAAPDVARTGAPCGLAARLPAISAVVYGAMLSEAARAGSWELWPDPT